MPLAALPNYREGFGGAGQPGDGSLRPRRELRADRGEAAKGWGQEGRHPARLDSPRSVAEEDQKEVGSQRGQTEGEYRDPEEQQIRIQRGQTAQQREPASSRAACDGLNLVNLMRDIVEKDRTMTTAVV